MKLEPGYVKADSSNLPEINAFMVFDYIKNDDRFNDPELRSAKTNLSSRQSYGDSAIGYVHLKRDNSLCILKAKICPEHKVRNTSYSVTMIVNEQEKYINTVECEDCAASQGGCKHAIAFLMWAHRRSEEPSPTQVTCYWKKSALANVATPKQFIAATELTHGNNKSVTSNEKDLNKQILFFNNVIEIAKKKQLDSQISRHLFSLDKRHIRCLSIHQLMLDFIETEKNMAIDFLNFAKENITESLCKEVEELTQNQSDNHLWYELRYGRITASKVHEAVHCRTSSGSLVNEIIGTAKVFESSEMKRGKELEKEVLIECQRKEEIKYRSSGLLLVPAFPIVGASPDAIGSDFIIEVKSPSSAKGFERFLPKGSISKKCKAQMYLQMFCAKKKKGLFCVADPDFENNKKVTTVWLSYDENFSSVIDNVTEFWITNIFPRLINSVK